MGYTPLQTVHTALETPSSPSVVAHCMDVVTALAPVASLPTAGLLFRALAKVGYLPYPSINLSQPSTLCLTQQPVAFFHAPLLLIHSCPLTGRLSCYSEPQW